MPLPPAMARRRVVATNITDDGTVEGDPINGLVTYEAEVRELIVSGVSVFVGELARPIRAPVTNGALSVDLIAGDDPDVESGLDRPFAYKVTRSWDTKHPFHIVVPMGPTGVAADDGPINESTLHVPNPPGGVALILAGAVTDDDPRLDDSRPPTAHADTHAIGGSDPLTPAAIGTLAVVLDTDGVPYINTTGGGGPAGGGSGGGGSSLTETPAGSGLYVMG